MWRLLFVALMFVSSLAVAQTSKPITAAESIFSVFTENHGLAASDGPKLIVSIWGDGQVVWSGDQLHGGAPYFTANIEPKAVAAAVARITDMGVFDVPSLKRAHFGPDSSFTTILLRDGGKQLRMESWHELYEANGKTVATAHGLTGLGDQKFLPKLRAEPAEYLHYRMTWLELRLAATQLIPKAGQPTDGVAVQRAGQLSWRLGGEGE